MIDLNKLEFKELELLLKIVEFYQMEQSFDRTNGYYEEVENLRKKLEIAFID